MNYATLLGKTEQQQKSYIDFLPYAPRDSFLKISYELVRLSEKIEILKRMSVADSRQEVITYEVEKNSRINL